MDIYQSFLVQVHNCSFDSNGFEGVAKPDYQYRGHAGGLSIGEGTMYICTCHSILLVRQCEVWVNRGMLCINRLPTAVRVLLL